MPFQTVGELPKNVKDNLPGHAQRIWMAAFNSAYEGTCKTSDDRDSCASKVAWAAVSKKYKKNESGDWVKREESLVEFSFVITKASFDKESGERRFAAVASDTDPDLYAERMSLELYKDFINRAKAKERPPEHYASSYWSGGMPYLSISHYLDLDGTASAGVITDLYIDGNKLKAKGIFHNTPLGIAAFEAVRKSLHEKADAPEDTEKKIRISIAFLDWGHKHGDGDEMVFVRNSLSDRCPYCEKDINDVIYLRGHLIHLALTRVPVNVRTDIIGDSEVEKSMGDIKSRKDDAVSIIGEDLAAEIDEKSNLVGKSETIDNQEALIIKAEDETVTVSGMTEPVVSTDTVTITEEVEEVLPDPIDELKSTLAEVLSVVKSLSEEKEDEEDSEEDEEDVRMKACKKKHPKMMKSLVDFFETFSDALEAKSSGDELLLSVQEPFNQLGEAIRQYVLSVSSEADPTPVPAVQNSVVDEVRKVVSETIAPLVQDVGLMKQQISAMQQRSVVQNSANEPPVRRSLTKGLLPPEALKLNDSNTPLSLKAIARRSAGL